MEKSKFIKYIFIRDISEFNEPVNFEIAKNFLINGYKYITYGSNIIRF